MKQFDYKDWDRTLKEVIPVRKVNNQPIVDKGNEDDDEEVKEKKE